MHKDIVEAIRQTAYIPSMPHVACRFLELCAREDQEYDDLVDVLASDAGLTSELLRLANSPLFGVSRRISSLKQAMLLLGLTKVRSLVLSRYLVQQMDELPCPNLDLRCFWQRSLTRAILAARFCEDINPRLREEAFVGGLLADVGVVVLASALPEHYASLAKDYAPLHGDLWVLREQHALGVGHAAISAVILHDWQLPELIVEAVRAHHADEPMPGPARTGRQVGCLLAAASNAADLISTVPERRTISELCMRAQASAGLPVGALVDAFLGIEDDLADLACLLGIKIAPLKACDLINRQLAAQLAAECHSELF